MADLFGKDADAEPRCWRCGRKLAEMVTRPWRIVCSRCKALNQK
jgi:phage FluMu protein Com